MTFILGFGWLLFAALYAICVAYAVWMDAASYGGAGSLLSWRWRRAFLAAPWLMLSDMWDRRVLALRAFRKWAGG